jgi:hypothetical protein
MNYIAPPDVGMAQAVSLFQAHKRNTNDYRPTCGGSLDCSDHGTARSNSFVDYNVTNGITSFSQIIIVNGGFSSGLPVELLYFEATRLHEVK